MWVLTALVAAVAHVARRPGRRDSGSGTPARGARAFAPVLLVAALAVALAQTVVVAVLAPFARDLGTDPVGATWLLTAFMLSSAVATPITGRLGDQYGHRRLIVTGLVLLIVGSAISAMGTSAGWYGGTLTGRVIQGLAGGVFPCTFGLARQLLPARLPKVVAGLSAMFGVGGAAGMVAAGPLVDLAGLASVFWLVAGLAVLALVGTVLLPAPPTARPARRGLDIPGGLLLAGTLVALLLAISQGRVWGATSPPVIGLAILTIAGAGLFLFVERRAATPLIDLRLLIGGRVLALNVATIVIGVGMFAAVTLLPLFAQTPAHLGYGFGYSPARTGLLIAPIGLFMIIAAPTTPLLATRIGARGVFQVGAVLAALGLLGLGHLHAEPATVVVSAAVLGLAYGLAFGSLGSLVVDAVAPEHTGAATGINTILRTVGGAVGSMIAVTILATTTAAGDTAPTESGYTAAFTVSALIAAAAAVIASAVPASACASRRTGDRREQPEPVGREAASDPFPGS